MSEQELKNKEIAAVRVTVKIALSFLITFGYLDLISF